MHFALHLRGANSTIKNMTVRQLFWVDFQKCFVILMSIRTITKEELVDEEIISDFQKRSWPVVP